MTRPSHNGSRLGERGYSLVEVLVAMGLGMVALATLTAFNRFQLFALRNQASQVDLQLTARTIVDLMAREIRRAGMDPTCAKNFEAISRASGTQLRIKSDLNGGGGIGSGDENIRYNYSSSRKEIQRITSAGTDVLLDSVPAGSLSFGYYDANGTLLNPSSAGDESDVISSSGFLSTAQKASVRRIRINLALTDDAVDPLNNDPLRAPISTDVDLRNRYFLGSTVCP
jgi:type II secretory pathway component PulJ